MYDNLLESQYGIKATESRVLWLTSFELCPRRQYTILLVLKKDPTLTSGMFVIFDSSLLSDLIFFHTSG